VSLKFFISWEILSVVAFGAALWGTISFFVVDVDETIDYVRISNRFEPEDSSFFTDGVHEKLHTVIRDLCYRSVFGSLSTKAMNAQIGIILGRVQVKGALSLGDINAIFGSPVGVKKQSSEVRCVAGLLLYKSSYPEIWELLFTGATRLEAKKAAESAIARYPVDPKDQDP